MRLRGLSLVLLLGMIAGARAERTSPKAFLDGLYARYVGKDAKGAPLASKSDVRRWFAPPLATLIARDQARAARRHEVGQLDGDPFIDAQDWEIAKVDVSIDSETPDAATATAQFTNAGTAKRIRLDLVRGTAGWRISEIHYDDRTLTQILTSH
jgi:hypothetical protein